MYDRVLDLGALVEHRSVFLFGPRQTGKTTLVRLAFPEAAAYDLLEVRAWSGCTRWCRPRSRETVSWIESTTEDCRGSSMRRSRGRSHSEVDFAIGDAVAIEVKAKSRVSVRDYKGLLALAEEIPLRRKLVVCHEPRRRREDRGVEIVPVQEFMDALWGGAIVE